MSVYLAIFVTTGLLFRHAVQWAALLSVIVSTALTIRLWERGRWSLGVFIAPAIALRHFAIGLLFAAFLILLCDVLIVLAGGVRQQSGNGFPVRDVLILFVPAALHEELAFRGYVYQKLRQWNRVVAIVVSSAVFALLHTGNAGVSKFAIINVLIAGVLLALAYERFRDLWFPIGVHFAWNVVSGPVLGFPVSGFVPRASLLRVTAAGPALITGGSFGMEASLCMTVVEIAGIVLLGRAVAVLPRKHS